MSAPPPTPKVIVIGAGISGLSCAFRFLEKGLDVRVFEAADSPGGYVASEWRDGFLLEYGPSSCRRTPQLEALNAALGLSDDFMPRLLRDYDRYVYDDELRKVPDGPLGLIRTPLLSLRGKLRLIREPFLRAQPREDESVADFVSRHLGPEVLKKMFAPFVSGIYAGDPEQLSMKAAFPALAGFVEAKGSLLRGAIAHFMKLRRERKAASASGEGKPRRQPAALCSYREGLGQLTRTLAERLGDRTTCRAPATRIELVRGRGDTSRVRVLVRSADGNERAHEADALLVATPADVSADLLRDVAPGAAELLQGIQYTPVTMVQVGVPADSLPFRPEGFGFLTVKGSDVRVLGVLWSSAMFENRAPDGQVLLTMFYGGATDPSFIEEDDAAVKQTVEEDLRRSMGWKGSPTLLRIQRHPRALPAYTLGHVERVRKIEDAVRSCPAPLYLTGNHLLGISVADCVRRGEETASAIAESMPIGSTGAEPESPAEAPHRSASQ